MGKAVKKLTSKQQKICTRNATDTSNFNVTITMISNLVEISDSISSKFMSFLRTGLVFKYFQCLEITIVKFKELSRTGDNLAKILEITVAGCLKTRCPSYHQPPVSKQ